MHRSARVLFSALCAFCLAPPRLSADSSPPSAAVGTHQLIGQREGLAVEVMIQGPSGQKTPLQIACVFEYTEGDITNPPALPAALNGMVHLDQALGGLVTELRKSGGFAGRALETILISPPVGAVEADQVLLIGLGDRHKFTPALMQGVGSVGMREALKLGVGSYSHASDLKDAGIDSPTGEVAQAVLRGALAALKTQRALAAKGAAGAPSVEKITLLAGPAFYAETSAAARNLVQSPAQ